MLDDDPKSGATRGAFPKRLGLAVAEVARWWAPAAAELDRRWSRRARRLLGGDLDGPRGRALRALNPGSWTEAAVAGDVGGCLEAVDYHSRRLAKLDVSRRATLLSIDHYHRLLAAATRERKPPDFESLRATLDRLRFHVQLTVNDAYYRVRDNESTAFFDVLQDQLESLDAQDLLERVLATMRRAFRADGGLIVLVEPDGRSRLKAWTGVEEADARAFAGGFGEALAASIVASGSSETVLDVAADARARSARARRMFHSVWGAPLVARGRTIGVAELVFRREYHCLPREGRLFEAIAERCALAIDKALLLEALHEREERIRRLSEHMMRVEEEERRRVSRELHDEVGQSLLVARLYLETVEGTEAGNLSSEGLAKIGETRRVVESTIVEMRRLISKLSPSVLSELGLSAGIRQYVKNVSRAFPGRVRLRLDEVDGLPEASMIAMYRLAQECLTNAVKHSAADNITLRLTKRDGAVRLRMNDDGVGFDVEAARLKRDSFGLAGMRERVELLGGEIEIRSKPGRGTSVAAALPAG